MSGSSARLRTWRGYLRWKRLFHQTHSYQRPCISAICMHGMESNGSCGSRSLNAATAVPRIMHALQIYLSTLKSCCIYQHDQGGVLAACSGNGLEGLRLRGVQRRFCCDCNSVNLAHLAHCTEEATSPGQTNLGAYVPQSRVAACSLGCLHATCGMDWQAFSESLVHMSHFNSLMSHIDPASEVAPQTNQHWICRNIWC